MILHLKIGILTIINKNIKESNIMKLVHCDSENYYGKITSQVDNKGILLSKDDVVTILAGKIKFEPNRNPHGGCGIGTLIIGENKIHCLEREYKAYWLKIIRKLCKIIGEEANTEQYISFQPALPTKPVQRTKHMAVFE